MNRFGSVYELPKVSNAYYRHPFAIEITESNVTRLLEQQVFLSVNGSVQKLKKEEYTVVKNKGNWYQYTYHLPKSYFKRMAVIKYIYYQRMLRAMQMIIRLIQNMPS